MSACHSGTIIMSPDHSDAAASLAAKVAVVNGTAVVTSTAPAATVTGDRAWRTGEWRRSARVVPLIAGSAARSSARPVTRRVTRSIAMCVAQSSAAGSESSRSSGVISSDEPAVRGILDRKEEFLIMSQQEFPPRGPWVGAGRDAVGGRWTDVTVMSSASVAVRALASLRAPLGVRVNGHATI